MISHLIIPDTQVKEGIDFEYLTRIGQYIVDVKPDVVIHLGDFADMPSLSSYDVGKKSLKVVDIQKTLTQLTKLCNVFLIHCILTMLQLKSTKRNNTIHER